MDYLYFPGCTLHRKAGNFDRTARDCAAILGFTLRELSSWTCCGAAFPLATDNTMAILPPARILAGAREEGAALATLCSICFNVLKRTNRLLLSNKEKRERIADFLEKTYEGDLAVLHYLEILKRDIGFARLREKVTRGLAGMKVAAYYGCLLLRPPGEMAFDDPENPVIFEEFLESLGAAPVTFPFRSECCGSFQSLGAPAAAADCARRIIASAAAHGAEMLITSCPLCAHNLEQSQAEAEDCADLKRLPVLYFTQLLGFALGIAPDALGFEQNAVNPLPLLMQKRRGR